METLFWPAINFGILVVVLVYFLRAPVRDTVRARHSLLREEIDSVRSQLSQARSRHEEFSAKLKSIDAEVGLLREQARQDAQGARSRMGAEAQRLAANIVADAKLASSSLYSDLRAQLHAELGGRVLDRAEQLLRERLTGDDRARIRQEFSRQVEAVQ